MKLSHLIAKLNELSGQFDHDPEVYTWDDEYDCTQIIEPDMVNALFINAIGNRLATKPTEHPSGNININTVVIGYHIDHGNNL